VRTGPPGRPAIWGTTVIRIDGLKKSFGEINAVDGISFEVQDGEIFGLLGPNGAGKTTTISMISGILRPDAGRIEINGKEIWKHPREVKSIIGVVPQEIALYEDLTPVDNLRFWGKLHGLGGSALQDRVDVTLDRVGLGERAGDRVSQFSGGMKRRLNLAMGLLHEPRFLLLDEPTVGIDPQARLTILEIIKETARQGTTVLYTTHYMEEAQELCDRISIMDHGKILSSGTVDELRLQAGEGEIIRLEGDFSAATLRKLLAENPGLYLLAENPGTALLSVAADGPGLTALLPRILQSELQLSDLSIQQPSLQSVFIALTGRELRD